LGQADDPGASAIALSFAAANSAAMAWAEREAARAAAAKPGDGALSVQAAVTAYVAERKARSARDGRNAETRLTKHLLSNTKLAGRALAALTERELADWARSHSSLSAASVARLLNDTKAALNRAGDLHHRSLPAGWKDAVSRGLRRPEARQGEGERPTTHHRVFLPDADVRRLVQSAMDEDLDLGHLVAVLAATGARFSQAARLTLADVMDGPQPRLMMPASRKGRKAGRRAQHYPCAVSPDLIALLKPAMVGRRGSDPLLLRWAWKLVPGDKSKGTKRQWVQDRRVPWREAYEMTKQWKAAVSRAGLPAEIEPYRLRDASIIRGLRSGFPTRLVAQLHDTSAEMIERYYTPHIADALGDLARKAVVSFAPTAPVPLQAVS
jgi:integrase